MDWTANHQLKIGEDNNDQWIFTKTTANDLSISKKSVGLNYDTIWDPRNSNGTGRCAPNRPCFGFTSDGNFWINRGNDSSNQRIRNNNKVGWLGDNDFSQFVKSNDNTFVRYNTNLFIKSQKNGCNRSLSNEGSHCDGNATWRGSNKENWETLQIEPP